MESSSSKKPWHYILLWIIVSALAVFVYVSYTKTKPAAGDHAVILIWTPSDTARYASSYQQLHDLLIVETEGWTRTKVNGAWRDPSTHHVYAEDGFLYVISLFSKDKAATHALKTKIDQIITQPENHSGFGQKASYIELLHAADWGTHTSFPE